VRSWWHGWIAIAWLSAAACGRYRFEPANDPTGDGSTASDALDLGPRLIFVTSTAHAGALGGLLAADAICQARALAASLPGTYKVWLADATLSPASRMTRNAGPYQLVTGAVVAQGWNDLVDGMLSSPIDRTETGVRLGGVGCSGANCHFICEGGEIWSNVDAAGNRRSVDDCNGWTTSSGALGTAGNTGETDATWTEGRCSRIICQAALPLFCVQQ
jgi:hypothetical protein